MYTPADPRQRDYGHKTVAILKEPCDLEHLVVSIQCPPNLQEPLNIGKMAFWDIIAKEMRCILRDLKDNADLGN